MHHGLDVVYLRRDGRLEGVQAPPPRFLAQEAELPAILGVAEPERIVENPPPRGADKQFSLLHPDRVDAPSQEKLMQVQKPQYPAIFEDFL
jgi:hypothetical protein